MRKQDIGPTFSDYEKWTWKAETEKHDQEGGGDYFVLSQNKHHSAILV